MTVYTGRFNGRTAIVTGGASGLGLETAKRITAEGGKVCLWDKNSDTLAAAKTQTGAVHTIALDISDAKAVEAAAAESKKVLGNIDILVNSAGIAISGNYAYVTSAGSNNGDDTDTDSGDDTGAGSDGTDDSTGDSTDDSTDDSGASGN